MARNIVILGSGIIGLSSAYYAAQRGHRVTVIDRSAEDHEGCSFGNAGMVVSSHFVPLAAPGMVALGLKWMWNPESPFYIQPRFDAELFASRLQTTGIPDPDLLIRTSGEMRISNFLLWQISYAEIVIVKKNWPDFRQGDLFEAVSEYQRRHRRFGAL